MNLTTAMGLALAIDLHALLIVTRYREEVDGGRDRRAAMSVRSTPRGARWRSRRVTVALSLAAPRSSPCTPRSFAYAGVGVVIVALIARSSITPRSSSAHGAASTPSTSARRSPPAFPRFPAVG
ncbi:MMPL family transporter [Gordonia spumicola]|uniref:MMPL family transporter n=1 Tax=Gordonia spumicola TaxID=589161 RepID=UPI00137A8036|nr:MMPL family transporter [Gordonia spumicola]